MKKKIIIETFLVILILSCACLSVSAGTLPPDRTQQVLDLLAVECQNINDYSIMAQYGDTSRYNAVRDHIAVTINNVSLLMNGFDNSSINTLWNMYNQFGPDTQSAQWAAETCSSVRMEIYRKISNDENLNRYNGTISTFDECAEAGYRVNGGTCFIGGTSVFDENGNLIGFYYSDCYDSQGFHPGSCWDCYYGADNDGCIAKP
ncbi:MAG: hypothetical protein II969_00055 [Anaerolineaceae bacterium]|nr:hypothetical protein [Anaerolineaceae bacterium]